MHSFYHSSVYLFNRFGVIIPFSTEYISVYIDKAPFFLVFYTSQTVYKAFFIATGQKPNEWHGNTVLGWDNEFARCVYESPFFPYLYRCQSVEAEDFGVD